MTPVNIGPILISLLGGLAIFILGMTLMTQALNTLAGSRMKSLLGAFTKNRFTATLSGIAITATVQSSSVTTVLLVGFSSVGLITAAQSVGVIFGANVGSTITAQIIAFKIAEAGAPLLAIGLFLSFIKKYERLSQVGMLILGLGAIFFGMQEMSDATRPLRSYQPFLDAMQSIDSPLWGILIGLVFTAIVQSSAASIGLAMIFANQGLINVDHAIAIAFGANIGTCATATLAALGRPAAAWRIVIIHVVFNLLGVALWLAFIPQLASASEFLADSFLGDPSPGRKIAIAHTLFNVANLFLFIGFAGPLARLASKLAPDNTKKAPPGSKPIYLDSIYLETPSLALGRDRLETGLVISQPTRDALARLHQELLGDMRLALLVTTNRDSDLARKLLATKESYAELANAAEQDLQNRLVGRDLERMELFRLETDLINNLKRIHDYVRRVAKLQLQAAQT